MRQDALVGRQVAGRFTVKRFLGEGGMATVYVAEQSAEPHEVALKIMNEDLTQDRTFVKRFQREAKAASRVQHPNSVAIIDYGVADGLSYIAMELLEGDDLYALLEREGSITQARAARFLAEVCDALMVAHELGIVHRDLKPENIMVVADPLHENGERVKVLDFGIAKLLAPDTTGPADHRMEQNSAVTRAGTFIGTPAYMSPEQCALLPVDTRADIYTCGVLLFQLVTGKLPFEGQTPLHTATLHIHEPAPLPSTFAPGLDPNLEAVIMKALAKKPTERHQTARHLANALRRILPEVPDTRVGAARAAHVTPRRSKAPPRVTAASGPSSSPMESAKTVVAQVHSQAVPASVVVRGDGADAVPPSRQKTTEGAPVSDSDEARTLVRSVAELEAEGKYPRGPHQTEVIAPGAAPPSIPARPAAAPRAPKPTLKSASEFGPGLAAARAAVQKAIPRVGIARDPSPVPPEPAPAPLPPRPAKVGGGTVGLDPKAPLPKPIAPRPPAPAPAPVGPPAPAAAPDRISTPSPVLAPSPTGDRISTSPVVAPSPAPDAAAEWPPEPAPVPSAVVGSPAVSPLGRTVPLIGNVVPSSPNAPGGPVPIPGAAATRQAGAAAPASLPAIAPPALLPQTPPVYVAPPPADSPPLANRMSGVRGLLVGFLAGALIMALFAVVYAIVLRR